MITGAFSPKVVASGEGTSVEHRTPPENCQLVQDYGIAIQDDWVKELAHACGVKL